MSFSYEAERIRVWSLLIWPSVVLFLLMAVLFPQSTNHSLFYEINSPGAPVLESFWVITTNFGDGFFLFPLVMLLFVNRMDKSLSIIFTMLIGAVLLNGAKAYFDILRPAGALGSELVNVIGPMVKKQATPSGHTGSVFLLAGLAMVYFKARVRWLILALATATAVSRVVVGAHWPFDIASGAWVGIFSAVIGSFLAEKVGSGIKSRLFIHFLGFLCVGVLPFYDNGFGGFRYITYLQYALAFLALSLTVYDLSRLIREDIIPQVKQEGTLLNRGFHLLKRLIKFGLVGGSGFVVDLSVYTFIQWLGFPHLMARGVSYWVAATWNWFWNRNFTFSHVPKDKKLKQWSKYLMMCVISFLPNWGSYYLLTSYVDFFMVYKQLALILGVLAGMMFNFTIASLFVFSEVQPKANRGVE